MWNNRGPLLFYKPDVGVQQGPLAVGRVLPCSLGYVRGMTDKRVDPVAPQRPDEAPEGYIDIEYVVEPNYAGWRLDRLPLQKLRRLSRDAHPAASSSGACSRTGRSSPPRRVYPGLTFRLRRRAQEEPETPAELPVSSSSTTGCWWWTSPRACPCTPPRATSKGTLVRLLQRALRRGLRRARPPAGPRDQRPGGLRPRPEACRGLMRAFHRGQVDKEYLAICEGHPPRTPSRSTRPSPRAPS